MKRRLDGSAMLLPRWRFAFRMDRVRSDEDIARTFPLPLTGPPEPSIFGSHGATGAPNVLSALGFTDLSTGAPSAAEAL